MKHRIHNSLALMAWRNLWRNRRRTLLTLSSIVFGVFLAVLSTATQDRNWADMIDLAARLGGGHVTLQHSEYFDTPTTSRSVTNVDQYRKLASEIPGVNRVVERINGFIMLSTASENFSTALIGIDPVEENEQTLSILEAFTEGEMFSSANDKGIILGAQLAKNLGLEMGSKVVYTLTDKESEIVSGLARLSGIIETGSKTADSNFAMLPIGALREVIGYGPNEATQLALFIDDQRKSEQIANRINANAYHEVAALPWFEAQPELYAFIGMKVGGAKVIQLIVAILVAAGIFNTLFVSVMERLREFGIMVAIGFSPGKLFLLVMLESLWLAIVGLIGAFLVCIGPYLYLAEHGIDISSRMGEQQNTDVAGITLDSVLKVGLFPESVILIISFALAATLLAGLYPAWKAGHANPVDSLKIV